jgi:prepilin-type N-terminal cleavage/methylation domain-containing protein
MKFFDNNIKGFTLVEIVVSVAIFSVILFVLVSSLLVMNGSNIKLISDRQVLDNAQRVLDKIVSEVKAAKSIYTPTTTANQLSLETLRDLSDGRTISYVDIFLCGTAVCLKKEFRNATPITSDSVQVSNLIFLQITNNDSTSLQISLTVGSNTLTSAVSLRSY